MHLANSCSSTMASSSSICFAKAHIPCKSFSTASCESNTSFGTLFSNSFGVLPSCHSFLETKAFLRIASPIKDRQALHFEKKELFSSRISKSLSERLISRRKTQNLAVLSMASQAPEGFGHENGGGRGRPFAVLFVCLGNICRSPSAEAVFAHAVKARGMSSNFRIDSAGTINYHEGDPADARMRGAALKRGVKLTSISRPIRPSDFEEFDLILAMDRQNLADILTAHRNWSSKYSLPSGSENKVKLMCSYCKTFELDEVPDPYYGGPEGFEKVLDLLEDACGGLLESLELQEQTVQT